MTDKKALERIKILDQDVLFQKLGAVWYAFTIFDGEVYSTIVPGGDSLVRGPREVYLVVSENKKSLELQSSL